MEKALFSIMLSLPLIRHYFLSYKHIFYSLHSDHSPSGQFGYVADAVPLLRKCRDGQCRSRVAGITPTSV